MNTITGKILIKETGIGIPNLQIVIYDIDNPSQKENWKETFNAPAAHKLWQSIPGNRLGSCLTDKNGGFDISFDESIFSNGEQIKGPDLLLMVLAPEEAKLTTANRILHVSQDIVANASKKETYIIRIPQAELDKHQINAYRPVNTITSDSIKEEIRKSYQFSKEVKEALKQEANEKIEKGKIIKTKIDKALENFTFSKVPPNVRDSNLYLKPNEKVSDKLKKVVEDTLKAIPQKDASAKRKLRLKLKEEDLQKLGISLNNGQVEGSVTIQQVFNYLGNAMAGGTLEKASSDLAVCINKSKAEKQLEEALHKCKLEKLSSDLEACLKKNKEIQLEKALEKCKAGETVEEEPDCQSSPQGQPFTVEDQINRQMQFTIPPEEELSYGVKRNGEIVATISKPGPTENTAFHDFERLEIAFDNIWYEAFDPSLAMSVQRLLSEMIKYSNRISGIDELPEIYNVDDLTQLYYTFLNTKEIIEESEEEEVIAPPMPHKTNFYLEEVEEYYWGKMTAAERSQFTSLIFQRVALDQAWEIRNAEFEIKDTNTDWQEESAAYKVQADALLASARNIYGAAVTRISNESTTPNGEKRSSRTEPIINTKLQEIMMELDQRLGWPHKFDIFAPNAINYGLMFTYRQTWVPKDYQVGELVSTLPLAPKEVRKYSTKRIIKRTKAQKEIIDNQSSRSSEANTTLKADAEIVKQAKNKTSFQLTASASLSVGPIEGEVGTQFGTEAEKTSSDTKKNFREAVLKAAEEYKKQVKLEVETTTSDEIETTSSGEIMNPNEEITVTYLFYELHRQYQISEKLHKLTPVILVANEVPKPNDIDEDWLIAYDWILRRVILDDSFLPALQYVTTSIAGDQLALEILKENVSRQAKLVDAIRNQVEKKTGLSNDAFNQLKRLIDKPVTGADQAAVIKSIATGLGAFSWAFAFEGGEDDSAEKREEIAKMALERSDKGVQEVNAKLATEVTALKEAINKYTSALQEHFDRQTAIARLRIHVKENILYYMQAIWDYEPVDQRYFRLYNLEVPWIDIDDPSRTEVIVHRTRNSDDYLGNLRELSQPRIGGQPRIGVDVPLVVEIERLNTTPKKLHEIADLDNLLGFKGNYMIFPMKVNSYLHKYMMQDYIDTDTGGLRDPDEAGNYTTNEVLDFLCCMQKTQPDVFEENREKIVDEFVKMQAKPRKESELVVVPTGSLYIEALPGEHAILENFKLTHRALDVKKVQSEVRHAELENIRLASRLTAGVTDDPDVDKRIIIEGNGAGTIVTPEI